MASSSALVLGGVVVHQAAGEQQLPLLRVGVLQVQCQRLRLSVMDEDGGEFLVASHYLLPDSGDEDEIRDEIYSRNDSDVVKELVRHTDDIPIRVEMLSNYDCINSNWFESQGGYRYEESYFGDMVDSLNLNPARVKKILTEHGYRAYGRFPNRKNRNGKEQVSYEQFYEELINSCCGANLLTYIGRVSLKELYEADFSLKEVIIPKGNCCGLFRSTYGGGSLLEMELKRDVKLKLEVKDYHGFRFRLDDERSKYDCSVRHVYGVDDSFFGDAVRIVS